MLQLKEVNRRLLGKLIIVFSFLLFVIPAEAYDSEDILLVQNYVPADATDGNSGQKIPPVVVDVKPNYNVANKVAAPNTSKSVSPSQKTVPSNTSNENRVTNKKCRNCSNGQNIDEMRSETHSPLEWGKGSMFENRNPADEVLELRTRDSKTFVNPDGTLSTYITAYGSAIHYKENGVWKTISREIRANNTGRNSDYEYCNLDNFFKTFYSVNPTRGMLVEFKKSQGKVEKFFSEMNPRYGLFDESFNLLDVRNCNSVEGDVESGEITYSSIFPGCDLKITQGYVGAKSEFIIEDPTMLSDIPENAKYLSFISKVKLPAGWSVDTLTDDNIPKGLASNVMIYDTKGKVAIEYHIPNVYEKNPPHPDIDPSLPKEEQDIGDWHHEFTTFGGYRISLSGDELTLYTLIPLDWLTESDRVFPIVIDPTFTCYPVSNTCNSGGCNTSSWDSDHSRVYAYNTYDGWIDFYVYSVPDGSTVNSIDFHFYVNSTYYPWWSVDPMSNTGWNLSSWCGNSQYNTLWSDITAEQTSGYYNYQNESSSYSTGWHNLILGGNANSDCQQAINGTGPGSCVANYFSLGIASRDNSTTYYIIMDGWNQSNRPYIIVSTPNPGCGNNYLGSLSITTSWQNVTCPSGSVPYWSFNATAGRRYDFSTCGASEDTYIRIYDASMTQVAYNDDNGDFCSGLTASISWNCSSSGTYYISVAHYSCNNLSSNQTLSYRYVCANTNRGSITPTLSWQNASYSSGTMPYWSFNATAGNYYDFSMCSNSEDSYLRIYDSGWNLVASNDDNGPWCSGVSSSISWYCSTSGTYFVAVSHYSCGNLSNGGNLAYKYHPNCAPPTSVTATANGSSSGTSICSGSAVTLSGSHSGGNCSSWSWQYRWRTSSGTIRDWSTTLNYTVHPTSSTTYYLDVRCSGCTGSYTTDSVPVTVNYSASGTPSLSSPANGSATSNRRPTFSWSCSGCSFGSPNGRYEININGTWYNAGTSASFTPWWDLAPGANNWYVRIISDCGSGGTSATWTVYITPDNYCGNVNHGGNDWIISSSRTVAGYHYNVGTFRVNSGITATVDGSCHYLNVDAHKIYVYGTINAAGKGGAGGAGGDGGDGENCVSSYGDNCGGCDYRWTENGEGGGSGSGSGGGSGGTSGSDGTGCTQDCGTWGDEIGWVMGAGGGGAGGGGGYGGAGGAGGPGEPGENHKNYSSSCFEEGKDWDDECCSASGGGRGSGGSGGGTYGTSTGTDITWGSGGAGGGGGGNGYFNDATDGGAGGAGGGMVKLHSTGTMYLTGSIYAYGLDGGDGGGGGNAGHYGDCCGDGSEDDDEYTWGGMGGEGRPHVQRRAAGVAQGPLGAGRVVDSYARPGLQDDGQRAELVREGRALSPFPSAALLPGRGR